MTRIYLLRHGALADDLGGCFVGQIDPPLAPAGRLQAAELGRALRDLAVDAIYCSDLARSRETAEIIAGAIAVDGCALPLTARRDLREIALGDWESLSRREVSARFPERYAARGADLENYRIRGGESFAECRRRMLGAWREIVAGKERGIVVVGHAGANRALLCHLLGRPVAGLFAIGQNYGCVNIIEAQDQGDAVLQINARAEDLAGHTSQSTNHPRRAP